MVERKLYKTKLCLLHQRGRCSRQYCNFAHGDAELRRSFNGPSGMGKASSHYIPLEEFRGGGDLRERLDRMRSPLNDSPGRRDAKARHTSHGDSPRSVGNRLDRNARKRKQLDDRDDYSGRMSDGTEDQIKDRRLLLDEQLRETHSEIKLLENDKQRLEMYLEDKAKEADSLTFKIYDLEMQLYAEKDEGKRLTTKIKKFIKAHNRHLRIQDEMKRSQAQLQKLGEQLDLDVGGDNEDDPKIKASSDDVAGGFASPTNEGRLNSSSPRRKRSRFSLEAQDASKEAGKKPPRPIRNHDHSSSSKRHEGDGDTYNSHGSSAYEEKSRRSSNLPSDTTSADKIQYKALEIGLTLPSTGIAANALDEDVDVETDERFGSSNGAEDSKTSQSPFLPPPPPPPISQNAYLQYKDEDEDENAKVAGVDEEAVEVDID